MQSLHPFLLSQACLAQASSLFPSVPGKRASSLALGGHLLCRGCRFAPLSCQRTPLSLRWPCRGRRRYACPVSIFNRFSLLFRWRESLSFLASRHVIGGAARFTARAPSTSRNPSGAGRSRSTSQRTCAFATSAVFLEIRFSFGRRSKASRYTLRPSTCATRQASTYRGLNAGNGYVPFPERPETEKRLAPSKLGKGGRDVRIAFRKPFNGTLRVESPPRRA